MLFFGDATRRSNDPIDLKRSYALMTSIYKLWVPVGWAAAAPSPPRAPIIKTSSGNFPASKSRWPEVAAEKNNNELREECGSLVGPICFMIKSLLGVTIQWRSNAHFMFISAINVCTIRFWANA